MLQGQIGIDSRMWFRKEVGVSLHPNSPRAKDIAIEVEVGRIRVVGRPDITDIPGEKIEMGETQWFGWILIDVGDVGIFDFKLVDLDGIKRIGGISPSFLVNGNGFLKFFLRLREGDVESRLADEIIADQQSGKQVSPLNAEDPSGNFRDRRVGMFRLNHGQLSNLERQAGRDVRLPHGKPIALYMRMEWTLDEPW